MAKLSKTGSNKTALKRLIHKSRVVHSFGGDKYTEQSDNMIQEIREQQNRQQKSKQKDGTIIH